MARLTFLLITILTFVFILMFMPASATGNRHESSNKQINKSHSTGAESSTSSDSNIPWMPDAQPVQHHSESRSQKTEELPHIHHFHKERVKKIKRHHGLLWIMSKVLLTICHLVLLLCAFLHLAH